MKIITQIGKILRVRKQNAAISAAAFASAQAPSRGRGARERQRIRNSDFIRDREISIPCVSKQTLEKMSAQKDSLIEVPFHL